MRGVIWSIVLLLFLSFTFQKDNTYPQGYFGLPVKAPLQLSGTFGELRPGHFHSGIDIKGDVGQPLFAAAGGSVSRIVVSPGGYGKVLYLRHPEGYTTVYAHMEAFSPELEDYVKSHQHAQQSYAVRLFPEAGRFNFEQGEEIGRMGMTGHSFGPHLHFEIRESETDKPINPLAFGLLVADKRPPRLRELKLYAIDEGGNSFPQASYVLRGGGASYQPAAGKILYTSSRLTGIGLSAFDQQNLSYNRNGIYELKMLVDDSLRYQIRMDEFRFEESGYLSAHIDYAALHEKGEYYNRCYLMPGNYLSAYEREDGVTSLDPGQEAKITLLASDISGNTSQVEFLLQRRQEETSPPKNTYQYFLPYDEPSIVQTPSLQLFFPDSTLYENLYLHYEPLLEDSYNIYSLVHRIQDGLTPLHRKVEIAIRPTLLIPDPLKDKAFIAYCSPEGHVANYGGQWEDGFLRASVGRLGDFYISTDAVPPTIEPLNFQENMRGLPALQFRIYDDIAAAGQLGRLSYYATIDGQWVLFAYDEKNQLLEHTFEDTLPEGSHHLYLEVKDPMGNTSTFQQAFSR